MQINNRNQARENYSKFISLYKNEVEKFRVLNAEKEKFQSHYRSVTENYLIKEEEFIEKFDFKLNSIHKLI